MSKALVDLLSREHAAIGVFLELLGQEAQAMTDGAFTELGQERRRWIEDRTDELSTAPYAAVGDDGCDRLRSLGRPWSVAMMAAIG